MTLRPVLLHVTLACACGVDAIDHIDGASTGGTFATGTSISVSSAAAFEGGNFPEPVQTACGPVRGGAPMRGLQAAWGVLALPGARDEAGRDVEPGSIRLRLADQAIGDCGDAFSTGFSCNGGESTGSDSGRSCGWGFAFTLSPDEALEGPHRLESLVHPGFELAVDDHSGFAVRATGQLEIVGATERCIFGELTDVATDYPTDANLDGAFVAELCQRVCVPGPGQGC